MDLPKRDFSNVVAFVNSCGPVITFALESAAVWLIHRHCCLARESIWETTTYAGEAHYSPEMLEPVKGPFIVVRDIPPRETPSSYSSNGNGDSEAGHPIVAASSTNGNGNGVAWIFSEFELAVEANPPYIIVDSAYADEIAKNIARGNMCRLFCVVGSVVSAGLAFPIQSLPVSVPLLSMTIATAGFYGIFYMKDPSMRYTAVGRKWRTNGFQLSPEHFLYTEQPPLVLKAANSRFRKALRILPTFLPVVSAGVVAWRFWKVLS